MSCETGAIEVQLKGESMEICVEVSGNGRDIRVKLVVIISENFITKMDLLGKLIFLNQFEKTLQSLWCFVYCQLIVLHVRLFDLDVVGNLVCASLLLNVFF